MVNRIVIYINNKLILFYIQDIDIGLSVNMITYQTVFMFLCTLKDFIYLQRPTIILMVSLKYRV